MSSKFFSNNHSDDSSDGENSDDDNVVNNQQINDNNNLQNIDKNVTIRYIKEGKAARTYIDGLEYFVTDLNDINIIVKDIQKKLSTGYFKNKETNNHGFNGEHKLKIEKILINSYNIPKNKIKVC